MKPHFLLALVFILSLVQLNAQIPQIDVKHYKIELSVNDADDTIKVLEALDRVKHILDKEYGYSGWKTAKGRKISVLHIDAKVRH